MAPSDIELGPSSFPQSIFSPAAFYDSLACGYDDGFRAAGSDASYIQNVSPQQVFGHQLPYTNEYHRRASRINDQASRPIKAEPLALELLAVGPCVGQEQDEQWAAIQQRDGSGTGVDTLMKTIQTQIGRPLQQIPHACTERANLPGGECGTKLSAQDSSKRRSPSARRRYPCRIHSCVKVFTQKTHLEIHMRAHTGYKPYVRYPQDLLESIC